MSSLNEAPQIGRFDGIKNKLMRREKLTDTVFLLTITISLFITIYALAVIFLGDKGFGKIQMFFNLFNENAALIVIACGLSIVMVTGSIDISVGGSTALICTACIVCLNNYGFNFLTSLILALAIGLAFGLFQGILIAYLEIQPFIVTLAGMFLGRGLVALIEVNQIQVANAGFEKLSAARIEIPFLGDYNKKGIFLQSKLEYGVVVALIIVVLIFLLLRKTSLGRSFYAVGGNPQSALMLGINVKKDAVSGACALWTSRRHRRVSLLVPHAFRIGPTSDRPRNGCHIRVDYRRYTFDRRCGQHFRNIVRCIDRRNGTVDCYGDWQSGSLVATDYACRDALLLHYPSKRHLLSQEKKIRINSFERRRLL